MFSIGLMRRVQKTATEEEKLDERTILGVERGGLQLRRRLRRKKRRRDKGFEQQRRKMGLAIVETRREGMSK